MDGGDQKWVWYLGPRTLKPAVYQEWISELGWFLLETYWNKNWYCFDFNLMGSDLGFTTRFWISMTELFVTMNSFTMAEINRNQCIYQWICDIQIIWIIAKNHCFWTLCTLNYVDCIPFSCIDYFHMAHD